MKDNILIKEYEERYKEIVDIDKKIWIQKYQILKFRIFKDFSSEIWYNIVVFIKKEIEYATL